VPDVEALADRLRIAVQGCTLHIHGPVQAWAAIDDAGVEAEVLRIVTDKSREKMRSMAADGVSEGDPRMVKEFLTIGFCRALLDSGQYD
jgi:hypothetical protein